MGRPHRYLAAGAYYHVGIRGNNYAPIVLDDGDRIVFFHILRRIERRYGWRTHVRCLMGNHYHLLVETPLPNLSDGMRDLNGAYARAFNERHKREDHVFGRRYWSRVIESDDQYEATVDYIVKLIRQLSLVAYLMAERRLLTARDVKSNVEGYSEMSDEAFARRFYSDRAELLALGVPLQSQRDEFTGEELYTLRSENYFLAELELEDDELAALQTALYLLEGQFAYSEPLRLALQNLALGRQGFGESASETAVRVEMLDPDYTPEMPGRLGKLEGAISKQRTIKFPYYSISRNRQGERTLNPYGLLSDNGSWYVIGQDLDRKDIRTFRVSRIRGDIRFATRRERDFRIPPDFDIDEYRGRPPWQIGDIEGEARIELAGDTAWWVERAFGNAGELEDGMFVTGYSSLPQLASWMLRQDGRAIPVEPDELRREVATALRAVRDRHEESPPKLAAPSPVPRVEASGER